jgi:hypothetical protein
VFCPRCGDEYREGFTRCHDCDVALVAVLPEAGPAAEAAPAPDAPLPPVPTGNPRGQALALVLFSALTLPLMSRVQTWTSKIEIAARPGHDAAFESLTSITRDVSLLCLLIYVLARQGRRASQLGLSARWSDLGWGLALTLLACVPWVVTDLLVHRRLSEWVLSPVSWAPLTLVGVLSLATYAAKLHLVLGAYVLTEVEALTGSALAAVAGAIGAQESYAQHGLAGVITLALFTTYYWRTRRATPLILATLGSSVWFWMHYPPP